METTLDIFIVCGSEQKYELVQRFRFGLGTDIACVGLFNWSCLLTTDNVNRCIMK